MPTVGAEFSNGRVLVTLDGLPVVAEPLPATPWTLYRTDGATSVPVRGAEGRPLTESSATVVVDVEYPLERPFAYVLRYETSGGEVSASSAWLTVSAPLPLLSDPITGDAAEVTVVTWPTRTRMARSSALSVDGRRSPYVVVGRMTAAESTITLRTVTADQAVRVAALLDPGATLLLRAVDDGVPDTYLLPSQVVEQRLTNRAADVRRLWEVQATEVVQPDPGIESTGPTLADLADAFPSPLDDLADIEAAYSTLLQIAQDNLS